MLNAERLNLRMFIDGIEVPIVGARATFTEGMGATAEAQVIATDEVWELPPRSFATIYYYDSFDYVQGPKGDPREIKIGPYDLRRWKLLFAGEIAAVNIAKQAQGRMATIALVDHTNYWDFVKQHYINFRNGGVELFEAAFMGVRQDRLKFFDVVTTGTHSKLFLWLTQTKGTNGEPNLYLGVQRVLREMFFASNDFYATAFNRLRIGDSIVGVPQDETAAKLFKLQFFEKWIKNQVGGGGGMVSARQLVDLLLGPVFHTYVTVPAPKFDRKGASLGINFNPEEQADKALLNGIIDRSGSWPGSSLNYTIVKPDTWFLAPPLCNVIFPHMYSEMSFGRNYLAEPTRMFLRTSLLFTGRSKWLTERFYAPDFEAFNELLYQKGGYFDRMSRVLLPHETFVGLNPAQVWQADLTAYVQKGARRDYLSKLTDYLYWKYRFGTRNLNGAGPFNPNLVPGYPALLMDRVKESGSRHYLGCLRSVVHSIDQTGGWTHFSIVGARVHDEEIDFDGKGRGLEAITSRGTDGFLDDRYDGQRIGDEVYEPLFGCGSIFSLIETSSITETVTEENTKITTRTIPTEEEIEEEKKVIEADFLANPEASLAVDAFGEPLDSSSGVSLFDPNLEDTIAGQDVRVKLNDWIANFSRSESSTSTTTTTQLTADATLRAVENLITVYRIAMDTYDVHKFAQNLTYRPKATLPEMMGTNIQIKPQASGVDGEQTFLGSVAFEATDPDLSANEGFFATAVDPIASVTQRGEITYTTQTTSSRKRTPEEVAAYRKQRAQDLAATSENPLGGFGQSDPDFTGPPPPGETIIGELRNENDQAQLEIDVAEYEETPVVTTNPPVTETVKLQLDDILDERRKKVEIYVDSLKLRGRRG